MTSPPHSRASRTAGFTLVEIAVVLLIVGLLVAGAWAVLLAQLAQLEQRERDETQRRLDAARELLIGFALVNRRLPCPASSAAGGDESPAAGGVCTNAYNGYLPGRALGYQPVDSQGYALDAWGNRLRYAVSKKSWSGTGRFTTKPAPAAGWSIDNTPDDLIVCGSAIGKTLVATGSGPRLRCASGYSVTNVDTVVLIVFSTGKTGMLPDGSGDETENLNGDELFVHRTPVPAGMAGGEFDHMLVWLPVSVLYSRMIAAGILP